MRGRSLESASEGSVEEAWSSQSASMLELANWENVCAYVLRRITEAGDEGSKSFGWGMRAKTADKARLRGDRGLYNRRGSSVGDSE